MKSRSARPHELNAAWHLVDADGLVLGRMASFIAALLRGKHKPCYTPHLDCGDHVIVVNAARVQLTGNKRADKIYYRHTGWPGGIKSRKAGETLEGRYPERVVRDAVRRMLPRGPLARRQFAKLRVYAAGEHPHAAQNPQLLAFGERNAKNRRQGR